MGIIGENGAGKTTTIKAMLNMIKVDSGSINIFELDHIKEETTIKENIGVVFDEMGFHEFMTGKDINIMMKNIYKNWDENVFFEYLKKFSLPSKKPCGDFSRGMRMKLQIAVALSHNAKLLIMDEPTSGLDPIVRNEMLQIFREYVIEEDHTILLSSHIKDENEKSYKFGFKIPISDVFKDKDFSVLKIMSCKELRSYDFASLEDEDDYENCNKNYNEYFENIV